MKDNILEEVTRISLDILINQSLVKRNEDGIIIIYDQLQDMGQKIVKNKLEYMSIQMWNMNIELLEGFSNKIYFWFFSK